MPRPGLIGRLGAVLAVAAWTTSCGIRLPDTPQPGSASTVRQPVSVPASPTASPAVAEERDPDVLVYLLADSIHTGMVFPYDWLLESGFIPPDGFGTPRYVTLSWGDRTAYQEKGLHTPWKLFRALFTPTPSVMELIPADWDVTEVCVHQRIWRNLVPRERGRDLAAFLNDCSTMGADGKPIVCGTSSWGGGVLLESRHIYFVPRMCNTWTSQAIESMGGTINPWRAITADGLIRQAERPPNAFEQIWWGDGEAP
ncbi:MAG: DUF2459 domain-containing protein [Verrucomicrobiota bacterium]